MTLEERYIGQKPSVDHFRVFGCLAYYHIPSQDRRKLDSKSSKCLFLGYDANTKAYRAYDPQKRKIIISRDLIFDETKVGLSHLTNQEPSLPDTFPLGLPSIANDSTDPESTPPNPESSPPQSPQLASSDPSQSDYQPTLNEEIPDTLPLEFPMTSPFHDLPINPPSQNQPTENPQRRYPNRKRTPSTRLKEFWTFVSKLLEEPMHYNEALQDPKWRTAMESEINSIQRNQT